MADWMKILLKTGLIATVMVALWAVFTQIQIPTLSYQSIFIRVGTGIKLLTYWIPVFPIIWTATLTMLGILIALWTFRFGMVAIRWLFKVNE